MSEQQAALFDGRGYKGIKPQALSVTPPAVDMTIAATIPAYHAYLSSAGYSKYTPDDFTADIKRLAQYTASKRLQDVQTGDIQQYIGQLKQSMIPKTANRKISAIVNYFRWLEAEKVLPKNPAKNIRAGKVQAPPPDLLFENETERLLEVASHDPRTYMLVMLLLETGIKKAELLELTIDNFDFSNKYQPEVWIKHSGKLAYKDRRLKLPGQIAQVFADYTHQHGISGLLFPYTPRFLEQMLAEAARNAKITKKVSAGILRDMFVVRSVKQGMKLEDAFAKIGLSKSSYDDARKKYGRLTSEAL